MDRLALEEKITEIATQLKTEVGEYELESFVGFFSYFIKYRVGGEDSFIHHFESKLKDFTYLITLNIASPQRGLKKMSVSQEQSLKRWAEMLMEMKSLYKANILGDYLGNDEGLKKVIHQVCFHTYFENGLLSYVEQDVDRLKKVFSRYDEVIMADFGFDTKFLVDLYHFSEYVTKIKFNEQQQFSRDPTFQKMLADEAPIAEKLEKLPDDLFWQMDRFKECTHSSMKFTREEYAAVFPAYQVDRFLEIFSFEPEVDDRLLFFTQRSILEDKPIIKLPSGEYLYPYQRNLPVAFSSFLYKHLLGKAKLKDKLRKHRDMALENKTEDMFRSFFAKEKDVRFFRGYHIADNGEQDLLILWKRTALIVEIKASKYREPYRHPETGFDRIRSDFKESIQYGYEQCVRVEDFFYGEEKFSIIEGKSEHVVDPGRYEKIYSIVVTLERFGPIQTDLKLLLKKEEDFDFPWSVYIDDLETFLLALKKLNQSPIIQFLSYLEGRMKLHGRMYASDELDIGATFISNRKLFQELSRNADSSADFGSENQQLFDQLYFNSGLGFNGDVAGIRGSGKDAKFLKKINGYRVKFN